MCVYKGRPAHCASLRSVNPMNSALSILHCMCMCSQGDVQMSVTVLLVLGDRGREVVDEVSMEQWYSSYIGTCINITMREKMR